MTPLPHSHSGLKRVLTGGGMRAVPHGRTSPGANARRFVIPVVALVALLGVFIGLLFEGVDPTAGGA